MIGQAFIDLCEELQTKETKQLELLKAACQLVLASRSEGANMINDVRKELLRIMATSNTIN